MLTLEPIRIVPRVWTTGQIQRVMPLACSIPSEGERRFILVDGEEADDQILDDQVLWIDVETYDNEVIQTQVKLAS